MFEQLFHSPSAIARHANAPYAEERRRYLAAGAHQGKSRPTLWTAARELLWVAHKLSVYGDLHQITMAQVQAVADDWTSREHAWGRPLDTPRTRDRYLRFAVAWLRFLGHLQTPVEPIPFQQHLHAYCRWAREERGLSAATIRMYASAIKHFLRWYGAFGRAFADIQVSDVDAYLSHGSARGWRRITMSNVATALRAFFRYGVQQHWTRVSLAEAIQGPRIYTDEGMPAGPAWSDVRRLLAALDMRKPTDVRDRPILMLMAIYGLRVSEVATLQLNQVDWEHDQLHVRRAKRQEAQVYPLVPSVGNAIVHYLTQVRPRPSAYREVFLTVLPPFQPMSTTALYHVASRRLQALGVRTAHHGPHSLRHACAARLVAEGLSLKEIGDHLGHRTTSATRTYAKVDLRGLREVAAFDVGGLL